MSSLSYLSTIERYHDYRSAIKALLASILTGIDHPSLFVEEEFLRLAMCEVSEKYPFVKLIYTLDAQGVQTSPNIACDQNVKYSNNLAKGKARDQRPYYLLAKDSEQVVVTEPYLSSADRNICISAALKTYTDDHQILGYLVVDIDLTATVEFFMGDVNRKRFTPAFSLIYTIIVVGLFLVVCSLLYTAYQDLVFMFLPAPTSQDPHLRPFGVIVYLTLALAVFDLGKTIFEEEVLMQKDIFRHSSTRRTITRFVAAILIAVSIESLLMMFKAALTEKANMFPAIGMMATAIGLLVGLGVYVYLGAKAEIALLSLRKAE